VSCRILGSDTTQIVNSRVANETKLARYSQDLYRKPEAETGQANGIIGCGPSRLAMNSDKAEEMRREMHMAHCFGVEATEISPVQINHMWPRADVSELKGTPVRC
jgi:glycine/D-amino acid oxidase-like deaminating enzyme